MPPTHATIAVDPTTMQSSDSESFDFHNSESEARDAVKQMLSEGDKLVALMVVEGLYRTKSVEIEKVGSES